METKPLLLYFVQCIYIVRKFYGAEYSGSGTADNLNPDLTLSYRLSLPPLWPKIPVISWRSDIGRGDEWVTTTYSYSKLSMVKHSWGPREQPLSLLDRVPIRRTLTVLNHLCFGMSTKVWRLCMAAQWRAACPDDYRWTRNIWQDITWT